MKRGHHHGALREALIAAALDLLDAEGGEGVTIRAAARRAGVSHAAPVNHFADRRALLTAVAERCFGDLRGTTLAARDGAGGARERLLAFSAAYLAYALAHPNRYRLMWRMDMLDAAAPELLAQVNGLYDDVEQLAADLRSPAGVSQRTLVVALCSAVHGYASMRIDGNFVDASDEISGEPRRAAIIEALIGASPR